MNFGSSSADHSSYHPGVEAPRNSLEQEEGSFMAGPSSSSSSSAIKDEEDLYIPVSNIANQLGDIME